MKINRIYGMVLNHVYTFRRRFDRYVEIFTPAIDVLLFGLTVRFLITSTDQSKLIGYTFSVIIALIFWVSIWRVSSDLPLVILDDIWTKNLINIFGSPLTIMEWLLSSVLVGLIKATLAAASAGLFALLLYKINIFHFGFMLVPFAFLLTLSGIWLGFIIAALIIRFGVKVQAMAWTFPLFLMPFFALYYPVAVMPVWAQKISSVLPMSYFFEGLRQYILGSPDYLPLLEVCLVLNVVYVFIAVFFIYYAFKHRMKAGMLKLQ